MNQPSLFFPGLKITRALLCMGEWFLEGKNKDNTPVVVLQSTPFCREEV